MLPYIPSLVRCVIDSLMCIVQRQLMLCCCHICSCQKINTDCCIFRNTHLHYVLSLLSLSPFSSCALWSPSCCIISSCPRLPGCSSRAFTSTACRPSNATSTTAPWGSTTPSAGVSLPLSQVSHRRTHRSVWCSSESWRGNYLLALMHAYICSHTHTHRRQWVWMWR